MRQLICPATTGILVRSNCREQGVCRGVQQCVSANGVQQLCVTDKSCGAPPGILPLLIVLEGHRRGLGGAFMRVCSGHDSSKINLRRVPLVKVKEINALPRV
eukprot:scaffold9990_cov43-Cyclotella_meneghiniana.AAC.2